MNAEDKKKILLIPSIRRGNGTGHIRRSVALSSELSLAGMSSAVYVPETSDWHVDSGDCFTAGDIRSMLPETGKQSFVSELSTSDWDFCVFDMRQTPPALAAGFSGKSLCIGLDEGGESRNSFDYLIDSLPNLETIKPNCASTSFLQLPEPPAEQLSEEGLRTKLNKKGRRILISFGGEDASGLSALFVEHLLSGGTVDASELTVVSGAFSKASTLPEGVNHLNAPHNLAAMLKDWDLVVSTFGLTCFEALYSTVPVILFNPSDYHQKLSLRAGIPEIGVGKPDIKKFNYLLQHAELLYPAVEQYSGFQRRNLSDFISALSYPDKNCRGCGRVHSNFIFRSETHSFHKCEDCGLVNAMYYGSETMDYGPEYFFEDYKKQYGKTYLEDFEKIKSIGIRRCAVIKKISSISGTVESGGLLDVGCGYGPFLSAASDAGFNAAGIDVSENAVEWVRKNLGFKTFASSVEDFSPARLGLKSFDAVTMWFVIEHLQELQGILKKVNSMLSAGGVFAFATPNYNGISRRRSTEGFLRANPLDHYTVWSPSSARKLLQLHGFSVKAVKCPVIHPSRFFNKAVYNRMPRLMRSILGAVTVITGRLFNLGDTFEIYAVKIKDSDKKQ